VGQVHQRGEEGAGVPLRELTQAGRGPDLGIGRMASAWPFSYFRFSFHFLFFCNLIYFIAFAKVLQNTSNQLLNSFQNQLNVLNQ
jgi:hypothetical protein